MFSHMRACEKRQEWPHDKRYKGGDGYIDNPPVFCRRRHIGRSGAFLRMLMGNGKTNFFRRGMQSKEDMETYQQNIVLAAKGPSALSFFRKLP